MKLNQNNYYSVESNRQFFSVSQYKDFMKCEAMALAKIRGEYQPAMTKAMLTGSFVDTYFEGTLDSFMKEHPEVFTRKKELRSEYRKANEIIRRVTEDKLFAQFMSGEKQRIISSNDNKRYPGKYPYRYANGMTSNYIINPHFTDSNFQLIIYGPVVNPQVTIGSTPYLVNIVLESGEYLLIDSRSETIAKVINNGERINAFHNRQKGRKFFRKIQPGRQTISWTGKFDFDLIIFEERGEPRWQDLQ